MGVDAFALEKFDMGLNVALYRALKTMTLRNLGPGISNVSRAKYRLPSKKERVSKVTKYIHSFKNIRVRYCGHDEFTNRPRGGG